MQDDTLFESAHGALLFAFHYFSQSGARSQMASLYKPSGKSGKGLVGVDGAAQAGFIRREVGELPPYERALIIARFSVEPKENISAKLQIIEPAMSMLGTGLHHRRLVDALVQRHFGRKDVMLVSWAEKLGTHPSTVTRKWQQIHKGLINAEIRAMEMIEARLQEKGMIP